MVIEIKQEDAPDALAIANKIKDGGFDYVASRAFNGSVVEVWAANSKEEIMSKVSDMSEREGDIAVYGRNKVI